MFSDLATAVRFLTIIPVPRLEPRGVKTTALASSMIFFPLVGLGIGAVTVLATTWLEPYCSARLTNLLLVVLPIVLTGGLHVDGFADFFDGFFQGKNREEILKIMKDSRVGVWGATSVVVLVLLKWELLMIVPHRTKSFLLALTVSRWAQVLLSYFLPYAGTESGLGEAVARKVRARELLGSSLIALAVAGVFGWQGGAAVAGILVFLLLAGFLYRKRVGGVTGDLLGATSEMTEVAVFCLLILAGSAAAGSR